MKTVLFLGFDKKYGLTYHAVDWILTLEKVAGNKIKTVLLTLEKEQNEGLHDKLKKNRSLDVVIIDSPESLASVEVLKDVDVVHCHGFKHVTRMLEIRKARKLDFKIVVSIHAFRNLDWYRPIYANIASYFYNKIDAVHFLSHTAKNEFLQYNILYKRSTRSFVFPLACNETEFSQDENIEDLDFYPELSASTYNLVYLANISPGKQQLWLVRALREFLIENDARLWLLGGKGPDSEKVENYIENNGLQRNVMMPGRVDRKLIPTILKRMDVAVCTSKSENSPHSIMEPMFAGVPVVTFDVGTASTLIRDFTNGFVVKNRSEQSNFIKALEFLLHNKEAASTMGNNNRKIAADWLTWDTCCKNCVEMYQDV